MTDLFGDAHLRVKKLLSLQHDMTQEAPTEALCLLEHGANLLHKVSDGFTKLKLQ